LKGTYARSLIYTGIWDATCHYSRTIYQLAQVRLHYVPISQRRRMKAEPMRAGSRNRVPGHHPAWEPIVSAREPQVANRLGELEQAGLVPTAHSQREVVSLHDQL